MYIMKENLKYIYIVFINMLCALWNWKTINILKTKYKNIFYLPTEGSDGDLAEGIDSYCNASSLKRQNEFEIGPNYPVKLKWLFSQVKGTADEEVSEADIISCVEFNQTGEFLATGDKGGRVVVFKRDKNTDPETGHRRVDYNVYSTFTSHEPEFDYLKSLEIEEKINKIKWLPQTNQARFLLSTNDKTIKLWRVSEKCKRVTGFNFAGEDHSLLTEEEKRERIKSPEEIRVPHYENTEMVVEASPRRVFANAHAYHINAISVNSDQETFISADDLRINLWHLQVTDQSFNIVDIKPANMEDLTEVITAAEFHPSSCSLFIYSSSKGTIRLCDMRERALCDEHSLLFEEQDDPTSRSFFSEIISSISDVCFSHSGRYILSRDYLTVKVWDVNMSRQPVETYPVHEYFRTKLCALYENDCIFDKFECCWSPDDRYIMTGSYNNFFRMFERESGKDVTLEASRDNMQPNTPLAPRRVSSSGSKRRKEEISVECLDFSKKLLHVNWHPVENIAAIAATNNLYILEGQTDE